MASVSTCWVPVPICLCLWSSDPIHLCMLGLGPLLPVAPASACRVPIPVCLCLLRVCSLLSLPVGYVSFYVSACWTPIFICLHLLGACLCLAYVSFYLLLHGRPMPLVGTYLLSRRVGSGLCLCRPTGEYGGRARGQPSGTGEAGREKKGRWLRV